MRALSRIVSFARRLAVRGAERRCDHRLAAALDAILAASPEELREFCVHSENRPVMGMGVVERG